MRQLRRGLAGEMTKEPAVAPAPGGRRMVRFLVVGLLNTLFSYLIYAGFLFMGLDYRLANLLALLAGICFSFKSQGRLVFGNDDNRLFGRYVVSWALVYAINITFIGQLVRFGLDAYLAGIVALPFTVVMSYLIQKHVVFGGKRQPKAVSGDP